MMMMMTSHGHKTGLRSMQPVRSVPLGGPIALAHLRPKVPDPPPPLTS